LEYKCSKLYVDIMQNTNSKHTCTNESQTPRHVLYNLPTRWDEGGRVLTAIK